jgi:hypothetical protein
MNQQQARNLLTHAAALDPTMLPSDNDALATKVTVWWKALAALDYDDALAAVYDHYKRDNTKSISVGIIYQTCQGTRTPTGEHGFAECNPQIIAPAADAWGGRYEVWCRRCGHQNSAYADTIGEAQILRNHHQYTPPTFLTDDEWAADSEAVKQDTVRYLAERMTVPEESEDWSEARNHRD